MNCPEMDGLVEIGLGQSVPPELDAHIRTCEACQADLATIRALVGMAGEAGEMSEELISRIVAGLPEPDSPPAFDWRKGIQLCWTWVLGFLTALVSVFVTGSLGQVSPRSALALAMGLGLACALAAFRQGPNSETVNGGLPPADPA